MFRFFSLEFKCNDYINGTFCLEIAMTMILYFFHLISLAKIFICDLQYQCRFVHYNLYSLELSQIRGEFRYSSLLVTHFMVVVNNQLIAFYDCFGSLNRRVS